MLKNIKVILISSAALFSTSTIAGEYNPNRAGFIEQYGMVADNRLNNTNKIIDIFKNQSDNSKLNGINNFFNAFSFTSDQLLWNGDYWEQPLQFIGLGGGDCEDFALTKYITLIKIGVKPNQLKINYVKVLPTNTPHMVLTYSDDKNKPDKDWYVLDNTTNKIKQLSDRKDLVNIYSFNYDTLKKMPTSKQTDVSRVLLMKFYNFMHQKKVLQPPHNPFLKMIDKSISM